ncbi:MAG: cation diffusion facilitator family transporter, partial [Thaumarchaeota archaeon]|nr:cation diffusion facilitator family transporter [Nitrososphaerota archaeon]
MPKFEHISNIASLGNSLFGRMTPQRALTIALLLSLVILVVELSGGIIFGSTALIADALHIVTDILAISFSLVALTISARPPSASLTYGYHRIEVIASIVNGLSLIGIVIVIMYQAYVRILNPQPILVVGTVTFAAIALVLNIISSRTLQGAQSRSVEKEEEDLNVSSARLHIFGDALVSLAVIIGAVAVFFTGFYIIDPLVAIFIGLIVLRGAISITRQGAAIILERSPIKNMQDLETKLLAVSGVSDIHDLHAWRICSHITVASLHACLNTAGKGRQAGVRREIERKLNELGVQHVTIQLEDTCCVPPHDHK